MHVDEPRARRAPSALERALRALRLAMAKRGQQRGRPLGAQLEEAR